MANVSILSMVIAKFLTIVNGILDAWVTVSPINCTQTDTGMSCILQANVTECGDSLVKVLQDLLFSQALVLNEIFTGLLVVSNVT